MKIKILLSTTKNVVSEGISFRLKNEPAITFSDWVTDPTELQKKYDELTPDCLMVGETLFGDRTVPRLRDFMRVNPIANLLLLSSTATRQFVKQVLDTGAKGIFLSPFSEYDHLMHGIKCVADGRTYICRKSTELIIGDIFQQKISPKESNELSAREKQIVRLIAEAHSSKEIALILSISPATVDVHRRNLMRKIGVNKAADITKYAIRSEMIFV